MATRFQVAFPTHTHPMMKRSSHVILKAGSAATSTGALQRNCADSSNRTPERGLRIDQLDTMVWRFFFVTLLLALLGSMTGQVSVTGE